MDACVQEGQWCILGLPDESLRLVQAKTAGDIEIGRFGMFPARHLIGLPYGTYYEIEADGTLRLTSNGPVGTTALPTGATADEEMATNQTLLDTNTSQRLTTEDIEALKAQVSTGTLSPSSLVDQVIRHSETFAQKNAFSQIKYVRRKQRKFLRHFSLRPVTSRLLLAYFGGRDPRKVMDLRLDSLSQLICLSNVQATGSRCMVWEETNGFLTGALLEHTDSTSLLVHVHPDRQMQVQSVMYFNFSPATRSRLLPLPLDWGQHEREEGGPTESLGEEGDRNNIIKEEELPDSLPSVHRQRWEEKRERRRLAEGLMSQGSFDCLLIATGRHNPLTILEHLVRALRPSGRVLLYSPHRELLLETYQWLRSSTDFIDVTLTESWLRPYQAAPGRLHPHMNCNGNTGIILAAVKVQPTPRPVGAVSQTIREPTSVGDL